MTADSQTRHPTAALTGCGQATDPPAMMLRPSWIGHTASQIISDDSGDLISIGTSTKVPVVGGSTGQSFRREALTHRAVVGVGDFGGVQPAALFVGEISSSRCLLDPIIVNPAIKKAIAAIDENAWTPVQYPNAGRDPDTGAWISDAEVAEIPYTAFASTKDRTTARLVVRRVKDGRYPDALFPVWRYHPFFTNSTLPTVDAGIVHRKHAVIETVFADLIDGPLAHMPSGSFAANSAWVLCAAIARNLLRATEILAGGRYGRARGATLRRKIVAVPARLTRPQRKPILHLPSHWPYALRWLQLWRNTIGYSQSVPS